MALLQLVTRFTKMKKIFTKINIIRAAMVVMLTSVVMFLLPHADHQSYSYELNQPWKYPLLTAPFDMPIMRDSTSLTFLRDSVDKNFVPFVKREKSVPESAVARFRSAAPNSDPHDVSVIAQLMEIGRASCRERVSSPV